MRNALVDNVYAQLSEAVDVSLTRSEISAFNGVVEKAKYAITVVLIVLSSIDSTLSSDTVRSSWRILEAERLDPVSKFTE